MKLKIYLDTSVIAACFDDRTPDRRAQTEEFWKKRDSFDLSISDLTVAELMAVQDPSLKTARQKMIEPLSIVIVDSDMRQLADLYMREGVFTGGMRNDALHVAIAVLSRQDVLVSWNFRHLVNRQRRAKINQLNVAHQYPSIEIVAPPEV